MITRWAIALAGIDPTRVKLTHLHAAASRLADRHHWASPKPWSARPPRTVDGLPVLEIITLTSEAADHLHTTATPGAPIHFGHQHGAILAPPRPLAGATWTDLHTATPTTDTWTIAFRTPATFGNRDRFTPWPDPTAVARSLTNRWNSLNPHPTQQLDQDPRTWRHIWVSDVTGHTELLPFPGLTVPGFYGTIRYRCDTPTSRTLHRLLLLAEHAGVGRYTTRGLGIITLASDPRHSRVASEQRKPARSVQAAHQRKQSPKSLTKITGDDAGKGSVQAEHNVTAQRG